jgi:SAM-dependent methyltransferase
VTAGQSQGTAQEGYYDSYWSAERTPRYEIGGVLTGLIERELGSAPRVLDVGCGAGQTYAQWVSARTSYVGVDVAPKAVELAAEAGLEAHLVDDASALPFEDDSFDLAICIEVLEHLFAPHEAAREIRRVLRPGCKLIASTPNSVYWRLRLNLLLGLWNPLGDELAVEQPWRDPHIRFFSPETIDRMLRHAGFSHVDAGAHGGCFLDHLTTRPTSFGVSRAYRFLESRFPSVLGLTIHAVAVK